MSLSPYTIDDVAADYDRTRDWASRNWRDLVKKGRLPQPIEDTGSPVWDRAQVYAVRDKPLPAATRAIVAAHRAAFDVAHTLPREALHSDEVAKDRARLDRHFSRGASDANPASAPANKQREQA